jgi:heme a synthase
MKNFTFNKNFIRLNWITLIFIYLVVIAGSFVRITGSGMGCPDWPKCFGQWIPPTTDENLPEDYKDIYSQKREKKIIKFANFLEKIGFKKEANQLRNDKSLLLEQDFNGRKTWTEYINRLFGVLAGMGVLLIFAWIILKYRKRKLIIWSSLNLLILVIQAWFGSIVVATNLVPWTITVHMLLALVIIAIQIYLIFLISPKAKSKLELSKSMKMIVWLTFIITFIQMFLGTQVREYIDELTKLGFGRESWNEKLG